MYLSLEANAISFVNYNFNDVSIEGKLVSLQIFDDKRAHDPNLTMKTT